MYGLRTEPVVITTLAGAVMVFAIEWFGASISPTMQTSMQTLIVAALALFARSQVTSEASLIAANTTSAKVMEAAGDPQKSLVLKTTGVVLAFLLALGGVACSSNPNPTGRPDAAVAQAAQYGTQAVNYVTAAQKIVNTYTVAQGGRTPVTDKISAAIRDQVIPQAERLRVAFNVYAIASNSVAQASALKDLQTQLDIYEQLVEDVLETNVPDGLAPQLFKTVHDIKTLVDNIRDAFLSGGRPVARHNALVDVLLRNPILIY